MKPLTSKGLVALAAVRREAEQATARAEAAEAAARRPAAASGVIAVVQVDWHGIGLGEEVTVSFSLQCKLLTRGNSALGEEVGCVLSG